MRKVIAGLAAAVAVASITVAVACDSTNTTRPLVRSLSAAPSILPAHDARGKFANPYRAYGAWHNALLDRARRTGDAVTRTGGGADRRDGAAIEAASQLYRTSYSMSDSDFHARAAGAMARANQRPPGRHRLYMDTTINASLSAALASGKMLPKQVQYVRRLAAIADAARNTEELSLSLERFGAIL